MNWPVEQIKFVGKKFYVIVFAYPSDRDTAISCVPWFYDRRFVYTVAWDPSFDLRNETYTKLPVWIEIPFRALAFEKYRQ